MSVGPLELKPLITGGFEAVLGKFRTAELLRLGDLNYLKVEFVLTWLEIYFSCSDIYYKTKVNFYANYYMILRGGLR